MHERQKHRSSKHSPRHRVYNNNNNNYDDTKLHKVSSLQGQSQKSQSSKHPALPPYYYAIIFVTAVGCFINSYDGDFVFDDMEAILHNKDVHSGTPLSVVFSNDFWGSKIATNTSHKSYRPLTVLSFRLNHYISGGLHPRGFHIANILLYGLLCCLLLPTVHSLIQAWPEHFTLQRYQATFLAVLMFAVHPVHTECVAGIVGRADLLCAICFCLGFLAYKQSIEQEGDPSSKSKLSWLLLCGGITAIGVLCKEQAITVIGVCSAFDILVVNGVSMETVLTFNSSHFFNQKHIQSLLRRQFYLLLVGVAILSTRMWVMGSEPPIFQIVDNPHSFVNNTILRVLNYNYIYALNCWILVFPAWLCFDWSMGCIPVIYSIFDLRISIAFTFIIGLSCLLYKAAQSGPNSRVISMSLTVLIVPFLPASNLFFRVGFVIAERALFLPSIGYCMLCIIGLDVVTQNIKQKKLITGAVILLLAALAIKSIQRSSEWRKEVDLFNSGAFVCPLNAKVHYNIGKIAADRGNTDLAIEKYRLAISLSPKYDQPMNNLANILKEQGHLREAENLLIEAVTIRPEFAAAWMNLGIVQAALKKNASSEVSYLNALKHRRRYPDCYYNLGNLYLEVGKHQQAMDAWRNATIQQPTHVKSWNNMMILMDNLGKTEQVEGIGKQALNIVPDAPTIHFNLANTLGKAARFSDSEKHFLRAIDLDSGNAQYWSNIGVLYHRWNKLDKAENAYLKALKLDSSLTNTQDNLNMLLRKKLKT
ncbi:unnamed protein product [Owenia fusiformis]|uniref:dolichyl-phosphate-mannose--protein mannosyltransferase n=1 Tax=Owenia fusiformis TaxID=6347 RepID=A0A8J1UVY0_OWEFU|nr:unnamed protein product [Owenia fusiformis]